MLAIHVHVVSHTLALEANGLGGRISHHDLTIMIRRLNLVPPGPLVRLQQCPHGNGRVMGALTQQPEMFAATKEG